VVKQLARDLQEEFPGISVFSARNLRKMKRVYVAYADNKKLSPLVREIGWTHNPSIPGKWNQSIHQIGFTEGTRNVIGDR
jgi:hypothetical protein